MIESNNTDKGNKVVPQELSNYRLQAKSILAFLTNQAYANKRKYSYTIEFVKGDKVITLDGVKPITNYYAFILVLTDKSESIIGKRIELVNNYYPPSIGENATKCELQAYKDFFLNGIASYINTSFAIYINSISKPVVTPEDITVEEAIREAAIINNRAEPIVGVVDQVKAYIDEKNPPLILTDKGNNK